MNIEQTIDENLKYIRELVLADGGDEWKDDKDHMWLFYRDVIANIAKEYAENECIGILKWMESSGWLKEGTLLYPETIYKMFTESEGGEE